MRQLRSTDRGTEDLPELLAAHREGEIASLGAERLIGEQGLVGGAHGHREFAVGEKAADHGAEERQLALEHGHVDGLAPPGPLLHPQRQHDSEGRVHARRHVRNRRSRAHAPAAFLARHRDHAALGLEDQVERGAITIGAVLAEAGHRAVDDAGVVLARRRIGQAQAFERARPVVLEDDVCARHELEEELLAPRMLEVHLDPLLVAVQAHEVRSLAARQRRAPRARDVAGTLGLQLDHPRAEVGEHGGAERAGEGVAQIDDGDVFERQSHVNRLLAGHGSPATAGGAS